jgi:hypothetical protein
MEGTRSKKSRAGERRCRRAPWLGELAYEVRQGAAGELLRERPRAANSELRPTERTREGRRRGGRGRRRRRGEVAVVGVGKPTDLVGVSVRVADRRTERRLLWRGPAQSPLCLLQSCSFHIEYSAVAYYQCKISKKIKTY